MTLPGFDYPDQSAFGFPPSVWQEKLAKKLVLPSFASSSLPFTKALACQTAIIGGGASFSLFFPKPASLSPSSGIVSLSSHRGLFLRPEAFYRPSSLDQLPLGSERLEAFLSFQEDLRLFLFPFFIEAFPLSASLGKRFLESPLPYDQKHESRKAWLLLPDRKSAEGEAA